jgi:hypothetical protein
MSCVNPQLYEWIGAELLGERGDGKKKSVYDVG